MMQFGEEGRILASVFTRHADCFDPATLAKLQRAFDDAWNELVAVGSPLAAEEVQEATRRLMAARIFTSANQGITDHDTLRQVALGSLGTAARAAGR